MKVNNPYAVIEDSNANEYWQGGMDYMGRSYKLYTDNDFPTYNSPIYRSEKIRILELFNYLETKGMFQDAEIKLAIMKHLESEDEASRKFAENYIRTLADEYFRNTVKEILSK